MKENNTTNIAKRATSSCRTTNRGCLWLNTLQRALFLVAVFVSLNAYSQHFNIGTNALYWATTTPNVRAEWYLFKNYTLSTTVGYNHFNFGHSGGTNSKIYHCLVYPEIKYWFCRPFEHDYVGLHAFYGYYNAGGIDFPSFLSEHRYKGYGLGVGLSYGYQWAFGRRWGVEASLGVGYVYLRYRKYELGGCGDLLAKGKRHAVVPTKFSLSVVYYIR